MVSSKTDTPTLLELLKTRVTLGKRFSSDHNKEVEKWMKDYNITTIRDAKFENLDNQIQIPYIFSTVESGQASIFEKFPSIVMKQRGQTDREFTNFASQIWDYLNDKLALEELVEESSMQFLLTGMASTRYGWDMQTTEVDMPVNDPETGEPVLDPETGEPMMQKVSVPVKNLPYVCNLSYKNVFYSPESKFILDDEENKIPYIYWVETLEKEQAEADYGTTIKEDDMESIKLSEIEGNSIQEKTSIEQDKLMTEELKRVKIFNYVGVLSKNILPKELKDKHIASNVYYVAFTKNNIVKQPEQIQKKPVINLGHYGTMDQFWRFGEAKVLRELEQDVSLGRSRIMDLRDRQGTKVAIPSGTEFDEVSWKKSRDHTFVRFIGNNPPQYINPPPLPETILTSINMSRDDIQMASATMDISRASMSNTVDTATGQKIFSGETNKRNAKKKTKIARYIRAIARNLLILCGQNWDEDKFAEITDIPLEEIQQQGWKQKLADLGNQYDIEIDLDTMGDTKEMDAANAIALYREMKDSPYINQDELIKYTLKTGFKQKESDKFLAGYISPETMMSAIKSLMDQGVLQQEDAQMIVDKLDMIEQQKLEAQQTQQSTGEVGVNEGRPPTANPVDIVKKSMPAQDATQVVTQNKAAYKQTGVAKGPQNVR